MGLLNWLGTGVTMLNETLLSVAEATGGYIQQVIDIISK